MVSNVAEGISESAIVAVDGNRPVCSSKKYQRREQDLIIKTKKKGRKEDELRAVKAGRANFALAVIDKH
jgi:hypothetical protein